MLSKSKNLTLCETEVKIMSSMNDDTKNALDKLSDELLK